MQVTRLLHWYGMVKKFLLSGRAGWYLSISLLEGIAGGWLVEFSAETVFRIVLGGQSSTLLWLVLPMMILGLSLVIAAGCLLVGRVLASRNVMVVVVIVCTVRWVKNALYVFPVEASRNMDVSPGISLTMQVWQTQQFAFLVIAFLLLLVTATMNDKGPSSS